MEGRQLLKKAKSPKGIRELRNLVLTVNYDKKKIKKFKSKGKVHEGVLSAQFLGEPRRGRNCFPQWNLKNLFLKNGIIPPCILQRLSHSYPFLVMVPMKTLR
jgi:hypothetical protein